MPRPTQKQPTTTSQPWTLSTTPLSIPSPRLPTTTTKSFWTHHFHHHPRSSTPPSLSPSPAPSHSTTTSTDLEIEELPSSSLDSDSGIELLIGEYEDPPENYGRIIYDSEEEEVRAAVEKLCTSFVQSRRGIDVPKKRSYEESEGEESAWSCDSGVSSVESDWGRRVRRRMEADDEADAGAWEWEGSSGDENEIDMEL